MSMKRVVKDIMDSLDGAGREVKQGLSDAFRKRGAKHRADADSIRMLDKFKNEWDLVGNAEKLRDKLSYRPRHRSDDYDAVNDFFEGARDELRDDFVKQFKDLPTTARNQVVEELWEQGIGQRSPDDYGASGGGDMRFLAPRSEAVDLSGLSNAEIATRFGIDPARLNGADVTIKYIPDSRFVSVEIGIPREPRPGNGGGGGGGGSW